MRFCDIYPIQKIFFRIGAKRQFVVGNLKKYASLKEKETRMEESGS